MSVTRLPRNKRSDTPPPMQVTDRDLRILRWVAAYRYMTREQVESLEFTPSTRSYCKRRLMLLFQNAYLDRHFLPLRSAFGAARPYYTLDSRGANLVAEAFGLRRAEVDWRPRDGRREPLYMEHALRINDVRVIVTLAARSAALELEWVDERELKRRAPGHRVRDPLHDGQQITIVPDGYFILGGQWPFALELDRGTVEEVPFKRKVRGYGEWKVTGAYERSFGTPRLRVLFVVTDARRDANRLKRIRVWTEAAKGSNLFWFAALDDLRSDSVLYKPRWQVARRDGVHALLQGTTRGLGDAR